MILSLFQPHERSIARFGCVSIVRRQTQYECRAVCPAPVDIERSTEQDSDPPCRGEAQAKTALTALRPLRVIVEQRCFGEVGNAPTVVENENLCRVTANPRRDHDACRTSVLQGIADQIAKRADHQIDVGYDRRR